MPPRVLNSEQLAQATYLSETLANSKEATVLYLENSKMLGMMGDLDDLLSGAE